MKKSILLIFSIVFLFPANMRAELTKETKESIIAECLDVINKFTYHISFIGSKNNSEEVKKVHIETVLEYFIGNGDGIVLTDNNGNPIMENDTYIYKINPPRIEITSLYKPTRNVYIKTYLNSLMKLSYDKIKIESSDAYIPENGFKRVGEHQYQATCSYAQIFTGEGKDKGVYRDITKKTAIMHIFVREYAPDRVVYEVLIGDIKASETKPAK